MPPTQNVPGSSLLVVLPHQPHPPSSSQRCPLSQQPPRLLLLAAGPRTPPPLPRPLQPSSPPPLTSSFVTVHLLVTCSLLTCPPAAGRRPSSELLRTPSQVLPASSRGAGLRGCSWLSGPLSPPRRRLGTLASQHLCLSGGPGGTSGCAVAPTADSGRGFPPQPHFLTMPSVTETSSAPLLQARSPLRDPHPRRHEPATNTGGPLGAAARPGLAFRVLLPLSTASDCPIPQAEGRSSVMQEASGRSRASLPTAQAASATAALRLAPRPLTPRRTGKVASRPQRC